MTVAGVTGTMSGVAMTIAVSIVIFITAGKGVRAGEESGRFVRRGTCCTKTHPQSVGSLISIRDTWGHFGRHWTSV